MYEDIPQQFYKAAFALVSTGQHHSLYFDHNYKDTKEDFRTVSECGKNDGIHLFKARGSSFLRGKMVIVVFCNIFLRL